MECPECGKKLRNYNSYFKHLGEKHSKCNGQCGSGFNKKMNNVLERTKEIRKQIELDSIVYDLKIGNKDIKDLSLETKLRIKNLVLENQYLKGMLDAKDKEIKMMEKHIKKCISTSIKCS